MTQSPPASPTAPARKGGLIDAGPGTLSPVFAFLIAFLAIDVAFIVVPWFLDRAEGGPWASPDRVAFLAKTMATSLAFGLVGALGAESRGRTPWWFLAGHAGWCVALGLAIAGTDARHPTESMLAAIATGFAGTMVALWASGTPSATPWMPGPATRAVGRVTHAIGNLWFGIGLLVALTAISAYGTFYEESYGTKAVQHAVYRSWWFGGLFFVTGLSMLAATFRKWPFRLEQVGWLTVHAGLATLTVGSMMSLLLGMEGAVTINEGATARTIGLATRSQIVVEERRLDPDGKILSNRLLTTSPTFDLDPAKKEPTERFTIRPEGEAPFDIVFDRYYGTGRYRQQWTDRGDRRRIGVESEVTFVNAGRTELLRLDDTDIPSTQFGMGNFKFEAYLLPAPPEMFESLHRNTPSEWPAKLDVCDAHGAVLVTLDVPEPKSGRAEGEPSPLAITATIPGTDVEVALTAWADNLAPEGEDKSFRDTSPGNPSNPAVAVRLKSAKGEDRLNALAFFEDEFSDRKNPYKLRLRAKPRIDVPGGTLLFVDVDGTMKWVYAKADGERLHGAVVPGEKLALPMPAITITPTAVFRKLAIEEAFDFVGYKADMQATRFRVERDGKEVAPTRWLALENQELNTRGFALGQRVYRVSWTPKPADLGFSLTLTDFHRDFYPGSAQARTYESYCVLKHPLKFPNGADIKIDMNHPLRLDGWRLYQARYAGEGTTTILQVNRDPGLALIYPATAIVFLGMIVVFFMKKPLIRLRKDLEGRGASTSAHVWRALGAVVEVGAGPVLFGIAVAVGLNPQGTLGFVTGFLLVVIAPILSVVRWNRRWPTPESAQRTSA